MVRSEDATASTRSRPGGEGWGRCGPLPLTGCAAGASSLWVAPGLNEHPAKPG